MKKLQLLLAIALLLVLVPAVMAGGWAAVELDEPPGEIHAGQTWSAGFTVLQHGVMPVHELGKDLPITPALTATNAATGERLEAIAVRTEKAGHFTVEITFPSEGEWEWAIDPRPLAGDTSFEPLTVLPPVPVVVSPNRMASPLMVGRTSSWALLGLSLAVVVGSAVLFAIQTRRERPAQVDPGRSKLPAAPQRRRG